MAKKKVEQEVDNLDAASKVRAEIEKKYGIGTMVDASTIVERKRTVIPISPMLNLGLGGGIQSGGFVTISGPAKSGKAQPLYSTVMTINGPKKMGEIKEGDAVVTPSGLSKVVGIFPQGVQDIYRVTFKDGDCVDCTLDHLWTVSTKHTSKRTVTTEQLITGLYYSNCPDWQIELPGPALFREQNVLVDPSIFGALINQEGMSVENIREQNVLVDPSIFRALINQEWMSVENILEPYGMHRIPLKERYIPTDYLFNSIDVRSSVLRALLDVNGIIDEKDRIEFCTPSYMIANNVKFLVNSLGGLCKIKIKGGIYSCIIRFNNLIDFNVSDNVNYLTNKKSKKIYRKIKSINLIGKWPCQCIKIASLDGLYLTDNFIITHNTTTCMQLAASAQLPEYGDRHTYVIDIENRFDHLQATGVQGLDVDKVHVINSTKDKIFTGEELMQLAMEILKMHPGIIMVIDSVSALCSAKEFSEDISASTRSTTPKLLYSFCRQMAPVVPVQDSIVIFIQHRIANTSGYGSPFSESGGNAIFFQSSTKMQIKKFEYWKEGENLLGQKIDWDIVCSALGPPNKGVSSWIRYGVGIDKKFELMRLGIDFNIVKKSGAWLSVEIGDEVYKGQGEENFYQNVLTDEKAFNYISTKVNELICQK